MREAREFGDCSSAIARKARVFHMLLLVFGPPRISFSSNRRERERARRGAVATIEYPSVFCIILILCATPREETRYKILGATTWRAHDDAICVFENKVRVYPDGYAPWRFRREGNDSFALEFHGAIASRRNFCYEV